MLNRSHYRVYQQLYEGLVKLKESLRIDSLGDLEVLFEPVWSLSDDGLEPHLVSKWRSLTTELHRELKLCKTDFLFLKAAKNPTTQAQRLTTLNERISKMIAFTELLKNLTKSEV